MQGFGAYGKMPSLGDFFRIGVGPTFIDPWDTWLQSGLSAARVGLGERWQDCFMSAPIWRFTLSAGLAGPQACLGVLMASVDRVGRQFPLTLLAPVADAAAACLHLAAEATFADLEALALEALEDDMSRDRLTERLAALAVPRPVGSARLIRAPATVALAGPGADAFQPALTAALLVEGFRAPSIWSATTGKDMRLMVAEGLPDARQMMALFDPDISLWPAAGRNGGSS